MELFNVLNEYGRFVDLKELEENDKDMYASEEAPEEKVESTLVTDESKEEMFEDYQDDFAEEDYEDIDEEIAYEDEEEDEFEDDMDEEDFDLSDEDLKDLEGDEQ